MAKKTEGTFVNSRKQELYTVCWLPSTPPHAVVYWHHGLCEYVDRYDYVFGRICEEANVAIYSHDTHGHGKSDPKEAKGRCFIGHFDDVINDTIDRIADQVQPNHPDLPLFMAGVSMGGLCATHMVLRKQEWFAGLMLSSAAIDVEMTPVLKAQAAVGSCLTACIPYVHLVPAVRLEDMNESKELQQAITDDPMIFHGNLKVMTGNSVLNAVKALRDPKKRAKVKVPVYAQHGAKDKCTSKKAVEKFLKEVSSEDTHMHPVNDGYHEILVGPQKDECISAMVEWLKKHMNGVGSGTGAADANADAI